MCASSSKYKKKAYQSKRTGQLLHHFQYTNCTLKCKTLKHSDFMVLHSTFGVYSWRIHDNGERMYMDVYHQIFSLKLISMTIADGVFNCFAKSWKAETTEIFHCFIKRPKVCNFLVQRVQLSKITIFIFSTGYFDSVFTVIWLVIHLRNRDTINCQIY